MSQAIISSPGAASQLSFAWDTTSSVESANRSRQQFIVEPTTKRCEQQTPSFEREGMPSAIAPVVDAASDRLEFRQARIGKPVRIGSVMFLLLKKYGISDEEIAEGIAKFAADAR